MVCRIPRFWYGCPFVKRPAETINHYRYHNGLVILNMGRALRMGFRVVVPCGKVITHPSFNALEMLLTSLIFTCRFTSLPLTAPSTIDNYGPCISQNLWKQSGLHGFAGSHKSISSVWGSRGSQCSWCYPPVPSSWHWTHETWPLHRQNRFGGWKQKARWFRVGI